MKKILIVCKGNTCRSPVVEALFKIFSPSIVVESVGLLESAKEGKPANEKSKEALKQMGHGNILVNHKSQWINDINTNNFDLIFTMTEEDAKEIKDLGITTKVEVLGEGIPNPYGKDQEVYLNCAKTIEREVKKIASSL